MSKNEISGPPKRNAVAGNAWRYNRKKVIPAKRGKGAVYKREKKVIIYVE